MWPVAQSPTAAEGRRVEGGGRVGGTAYVSLFSECLHWVVAQNKALHPSSLASLLAQTPSWECDWGKEPLQLPPDRTGIGLGFV